MSLDTIRRTTSLCNICQKKSPAEYVRNGDEVRLVTHCETHGESHVVIWRGEPAFDDWCDGWDADARGAEKSEKGSTWGHESVTLDVTDRCDLKCSICFADAGRRRSRDKSFIEICRILDELRSKGCRYLHISGGEPTVRTDLVDIVAHAKRHGFQQVSIYTNGIAIAKSKGLAKGLAEAGTTGIYLQFDGTADDIYITLRGKPLVTDKIKAIEHCREAGLRIVLVPTIVPGVNDADVGSIIRFAIESGPIVRGVHLQPIAYTGRYPGGRRMTLSEIIRAAVDQSGGRVPRNSFRPAEGDAPLCGFHTDFRRVGDKLEVISSGMTCCCTADMTTDTFFIGAMCLQDPDTYDVTRIRQCNTNVYANGKFIPLCAYNNVLERNVKLR